MSLIFRLIPKKNNISLKTNDSCQNVKKDQEKSLNCQYIIYSCGSKENSKKPSVVNFDDPKTIIHSIDSFVEIDKILKIDFGDEFIAVLYDDGCVALDGHGIYKKIVPQNNKFPKTNQIPKLTNIIDISCTDGALFSLDESGNIFMVGKIIDSLNPQKSHSKDENINSMCLEPVILKKDSDLKVIQIATGKNHLIALCQTGEVLVFGCNMFFQCGMEHFTNFKSLTQIPHLAGTLIDSIFAGSNTSCAKSSSGVFFLWGDNRHCQCATNSNYRFIKIPTPVDSLQNKSIKHVFFGEMHTIFALNDNSYLTCGSGVYGQLGTNNLSCSSYLINFPEISNEEVIDIDVGSFHTIAASREKLAIFGNIECFESKSLVYLRWAQCEKGLIQLELDLISCPQIIYVSSRGSKSAIILAKDSKPHNQKHILKFKESLLKHKYDKLHPFVLTDQIINNVPTDNQSFLDCKKILSSPQNLSGSFWIRSLMDYSHKISEEPCNLATIVDMNLMRRIMKKIATFSQKEYAFTLSLCNVSSELINCRQTDSVICAIAIFESRLLGDIQSPNLLLHIHILKNIFKAILNYDKEKMEFFHYIYTNNDNKFIKRAVRICRIYLEKMLIEMHHRHNTGSPSSLFKFSNNFQSPLLMRFIKSCVKVMEIFYILNSRLPKKSGISIKNWQLSSDIYQYINLSIDFDKYFGQNKNAKSLNNENEFSYFEYPFLMNTEMKSIVIKLDSNNEMRNILYHNQSSNFNSFNNIYQTHTSTILIDRHNILESAINNLQYKSEFDLKKPLNVKFDGEIGEDDGGLTREFFSLVALEIFDTKNSLFIENPSSKLFWFNPSAPRQILWTIGVIFGLAIHNNVILDAPLPLVLYKKLLERPISCLDDLEELMPEICKNLRYLLDYEGKEDIEDVFGLNFSVQCDDLMKKKITKNNDDNSFKNKNNYDSSNQNEELYDISFIDLIPNGHNIPVTRLNRDFYVEKLIDFYLNTSIERAFSSFKSGFFKILSVDLMHIFEAEQLQELLVGTDVMDFDILQTNCDYYEGYFAKHEVIERFWRVFNTFHYIDKIKFLKFLTGCERLPFSKKNFRMIIRRTAGGEAYLPAAHTCANMLDLPEYSSDILMKKKIMKAIYESSGFTLV